MLVGASHTNRMSALIPASLETQFLKLPGQSQMIDGVGDILAAIEQGNLKKGDFFNMDLLSNVSFMGTNEDGLQVPSVKDGSKRWHVTGSLVACPKPRMKKVLSQFETVRELMGDATLVCGLPLPRYVEEKCCQGEDHLENFGDEDYAEVYVQVRETAKSSLEAAFPGAIIFDPVAAFGGSRDTEDPTQLGSSRGLSIWAKGDPVHLTPTAYGDLADDLVNKVSSAASVGGQPETRRRIESVVTRISTVPKAATTPGWILGDSSTPSRGRGGPGRGFGSGSGRGGRRGGPPGWRGTGGNRWNPY